MNGETARQEEILAGPGFFDCARLRARLSQRQCLINHQEARNRHKAGGFLVGPLEGCLACAEGEDLAQRHPEGIILPPPLKTTWRYQKNSPLGRLCALKKSGAAPTATTGVPDLPPPGGGGKSPKVGRTNQSAGGDACATGILPLDRTTRKIKKELAQPAPKAQVENLCCVCGAPAYGKADLCFGHLLAEGERKLKHLRVLQARSMAKKKIATKMPEGTGWKPALPKTEEFYPLNARCRRKARCAT